MGLMTSLKGIKWNLCLMVNKINFRIRSVSCGKKLQTFGLIFVRGRGKIEIGNDVLITSCRETNPIGGDIKTILYAKNSGRINIGNRVGMSNVTIVAEKSVTIEDDVYLGGNCKIYDNDFHPLDYELRMAAPNENVASKPIVIKKGAFIGAHSIILKGVTVGEKSVIGAGAVVTKSVPDGEIWAGNPARFIREV